MSEKQQTKCNHNVSGICALHITNDTRPNKKCNEIYCQLKNLKQTTPQDKQGVGECEFLCGNEETGYINCGRHPYTKVTMDKCDDIKDCDHKLLQQSREENEKLTEIASKALDDKNKLLDDKLSLTQQLLQAREENGKWLPIINRLIKQCGNYERAKGVD